MEPFSMCSRGLLCPTALRSGNGDLSQATPTRAYCAAHPALTSLPNQVDHLPRPGYPGLTAKSTR